MIELDEERGAYEVSTYKHSALTRQIIQIFYYLKATPYEVGLVVNFGPKPRVVRKIFENHLKPNLKRT